jgi:ubiquitin carboxyl-terminal hydrolase 8
MSRGRRNQAYIEYAVARELVNDVVPRCREYPDMVSGHSPGNERYWRELKNRLNANEEKMNNMRQTLISEQGQNGMSMGDSPPQTNASPPSSRPSSSSSHHRSDSYMSSIASALSLDNSTKSKPPVRPKPESLHGNAIRDVESRFAALRPNAANGDKSVLRMPSASDFRPVAGTSMDLSKTNRLHGPRPMPSGSGPRPPPKIPIDTALAASMPRPLEPVYSPARNMQTPASVEPPRTTPRSIVGTGGRSNSLAAAASARASLEEQSYFPPTSTKSNDSRRKGMVGLPGPEGASITANRLYDYLDIYHILVIDVRSRQEFDNGHIDSDAVMCVEPLQLRQGMSASQLESSLSISPDEEEKAFAARDRFQLVVYYDQSTEDTVFQTSPRTDGEERLRILHEALVEYNHEKPLKAHPMVLLGGLDAWVKMLGKSALKQSHTQAKRMPRRRSSLVPADLPESLTIGKKRVRGDWNPLNAEEERQWAEQARSESITLPQMPEVPAEEEAQSTSESDIVPFYRTEEEFLRRFPAVPVVQESMMSLSSSPPPSRPTDYTPYQPGVNATHEMPSRPAPVAPRVSYSGAHDRNSQPHHNVVRTRYPPPYISPQEKPGNVRIPRTGLVNFGTTCYMNSIIQCLSATVPLTRRFQDGEYKKWVQRENWKGSRGLLPDYFANLVSNLWLNDVPSCRPVTFRVSFSRFPSTILTL